MKKLLIAAASLLTGFSLMADLTPTAELYRDALQFLVEARLENLATNMNFSAWRGLNQVNRGFNQKILSNASFDKNISAIFNQKVKDSIVRLSPTAEEDADLWNQGFRYRALVDLSDFGYAFTENADKTGFDVTESESGALEVYYTARSEDDVPPAGGEEPPAGAPAVGQPPEPQDIYQRISIAGSGETFDVLAPNRISNVLAVTVRFPEDFNVSVANQIDGGEWETLLEATVHNAVEKADPEAQFVSLTSDAWNINGAFTMCSPADSPEPDIGVTFAVGQDPEQNLAGIDFGVLKDGVEAVSFNVVVTNSSDEVKGFDLAHLSSLPDFATVALADCSVQALTFNISDKVALTMSVDDCATTVRLQQEAKRYRADQAKMSEYAEKLNEHVSCVVAVKLPAFTLDIPLELRAVKFGADYVIAPAFQFDPTADEAAGEEGWVALTDLMTQDAIAYAINIVDHAAEPAREALVGGVQVLKYLSKLVSQRIDADSVVPKTHAEAVSGHITEMLKAAALNPNFSSWERVNGINQYFNANVLNNPAFDKTILEIFNEKIMETIVPAEGEVAAKGFKYVATLDLFDHPYSLTATEEFDGFEIAPSESGAFEMITPFAPSDKASGFVKLTLTGSGEPNYLFGPSLSDRNDLAIILIVPDTLELAISTSMNGKDWENGIKGKLRTQFVKTNPDSLFVNLVRDGWNVSGEITTEFAENPVFEADATALRFELGQDPAQDLAGIKVNFSHNGREIIDLTAKTTATGEIMDMSSISSLTVLQDVVGLIASTRASRELSLTLFGTIGLDVDSGSTSKLIEVTKGLVAARRKNADFETIDAFTQQLNELVAAKFVMKTTGFELPVVFVTVPFGVTFNATPAIVFPDSEEPVPVFTLFSDDAKAYALNIVDQALAPVAGSVTTVKQVIVAGQSLVKAYVQSATTADIEEKVYGLWSATAATKLSGVLESAADGDVAGVIQLKVSKPSNKGVVKVSGTVTLVDGKKYRVKSTAVNVPEDGLLELVDVEVTGLGKLNAVIGSVGFTGSIGDAYDVSDAEVGGNWTETDSAVYVDFEDGIALPAGMTEETFAMLPNGEPVLLKNGKWAFNKAATVKAAGGVATADTANGKTNLSALKFTYQPKTGLFKGSFKIYTMNAGRVKKFSVKVTGVVVDGVGYGTTTFNKAPAGWSILVD